MLFPRRRALAATRQCGHWHSIRGWRHAEAERGASISVRLRPHTGRALHPYRSSALILRAIDVVPHHAHRPKDAKVAPGLQPRPRHPPAAPLQPIGGLHGRRVHGDSGEELVRPRHQSVAPHQRVGIPGLCTARWPPALAVRERCAARGRVYDIVRARRPRSRKCLRTVVFSSSSDVGLRHLAPNTAPPQPRHRTLCPQPPHTAPPTRLARTPSAHP